MGVPLFSQSFPTLKFWAIQWRAWQLVFISSLGGQGTISLESCQIEHRIVQPDFKMWLGTRGRLDSVQWFCLFWIYLGLFCKCPRLNNICFNWSLHVHFCCKVKAVGAWTQSNHSFLLSKKNALCLRERIALPWCRLERLVAHFTRL